MWKKMLATILGALMLPAVAAADPPPVRRVANILFHQGPWTYHAVYSDTGGQVRVDNVIVLADPNSLTGNNLAGIWYQRTETGWEAKSWETGSPYEVVKAVKIELNVPDVFDAYWHVPNKADIAAAASAGTALGYSKGVLTTDPLAGWVESQTNRDEIIKSLTALGWSSADILAEKTSLGAGNCDEKSVITGVAAAVEYAYTTNSSDGTSVASAYSLAVAGACGGYPSTKQNIILGGIRWTTPDPQLITPLPPEFVECIDLPDGRRLCSWNQPGDWIEKRWCLRFLPDNQHGPPEALCEQKRDRGRCNLGIFCIGDVNPPTIPPCEYSPTLECPPGNPLDPTSIPWVPDNTTSCPDCPWLVPN